MVEGLVLGFCWKDLLNSSFKNEGAANLEITEINSEEKVRDSRRGLYIIAVQRFLIYQKHEWATKDPREFLILLVIVFLKSLLV